MSEFQEQRLLFEQIGGEKPQTQVPSDAELDLARS